MKQELPPDEIKAIILDFIDYARRNENITLCEEQQPSGSFAVLSTLYVPTEQSPERLIEKYVQTRVIHEHAVATEAKHE